MFEPIENLNTDGIHVTSKTIYYDHGHCVDSTGKAYSVDKDCDCEEYKNLPRYEKD